VAMAGVMVKTGLNLLRLLVTIKATREVMPR